MIRFLGTAALCLALLACGRSTGGPLQPEEAAGVHLSADANNQPIATIQAGAVAARVSARWSDLGGQSALLTYENRGDTTVSIGLDALAMSAPPGEAVIMSAADITDTNLTDQRADNDDARILLERDDKGVARGTLVVPPNAQRRVDVQFSPFSNTGSAAVGNVVTLRVPMPNGVHDIRFVARRPAALTP